MALSTTEAIQSFLDYLQFEKRYAQNTVISYQVDLEQFFQYLRSQFDAPPLAAISSTFIRSWLAELKEDKQSAKSLNRKISTLRSFFRYQLKIGKLTTSPVSAIIAPKISKRLPSFVSETDMEKLRGENLAQTTGTPWQRLTDELILDLLYNTGMRLNELLKLKSSGIDYGNGQLKVLGKGNKERLIPLSVELINKVKEYEAEKKRMFPPGLPDILLVNQKGKPLYPKYIYLVVKRNLSGVTTLRKKSPHVLRHTFATHLTNNGAELNAVKELLGHSSLAATQVYTHNTIDKLKDIHKKAHPKA